MSNGAFIRLLLLHSLLERQCVLRVLAFSWECDTVSQLKSPFLLYCCRTLKTPTAKPRICCEDSSGCLLTSLCLGSCDQDLLVLVLLQCICPRLFTWYTLFGPQERVMLEYGPNISNDIWRGYSIPVMESLVKQSVGIYPLKQVRFGAFTIDHITNLALFFTFMNVFITTTYSMCIH